MAILVLLCACAEDRSAGGGGIETNNTVEVRLLDSLGAPVASAKVVVRPADWIAGSSSSPPPGQILTSDASGMASGTIPDGRWTFEGRKGGLAVLVTREISVSGALGALVMAPLASLSGRVALAAGESSALVAVPGTDHIARTDAAGRWEMDSLPAGMMGLVVSGKERVVDTVELAAGTRDSLPWTGSPSLRVLDSAGWVLLDNFSRARPAVSAAGPGAVWYMATDRITGGRSVFRRVDGVLDSVWSRFLVPGDPTLGGSFQAAFDIDTTASAGGGPYLQVGMSLPEAGQCLDLGALDSLGITFRATGPVRLEFRSDIHDSLQDYSSYPGIDLLPTNGDWTTHRLPAERLLPRIDATHPDIPWSRVAGCVLEVRIVAAEDLELGLSDLRIHGVSLERFLKGRER
jgi:hypothetical protein